ncbi:MAG: DUF4231 domain-containing protein [Nocardioides sp.]
MINSGKPFELPLAHTDGSLRSGASQVAYTRSLMLELLLLLSAATMAAIPSFFGSEWNGWYPGYLCAAGLFALATATRWHRGQMAYYQAWYEGRADAETAKSLSWRYAVGGTPFELSNTTAEEDMLHRMPNTQGERDAITSGMRELRGGQLSHRMTTYIGYRLDDQIAWYTSKSHKCRKRAQIGAGVIFGLQLLGVSLSAVAATGRITVDVLGICVAIAVSIEAWTQMRQYRNLSLAYAVAAGDLAHVKELCSRDIKNEDEWIRIVDQAEDAISREHTSWLATRI